MNHRIYSDKKWATTLKKLRTPGLLIRAVLFTRGPLGLLRRNLKSQGRKEKRGEELRRNLRNLVQSFFIFIAIPFRGTKEKIKLFLQGKKSQPRLGLNLVLVVSVLVSKRCALVSCFKLLSRPNVF